MGKKSKNTYESTEVNFKGGLNYGSNIHAVSIEINHTVWEMIKVLDAKELFGFHFIAKIGTKKTILILLHKDEDMLKQAKKLLKHFYDKPNILFLTKIKKEKTNIVALIKFILLLFFLSFLVMGVYFWFIEHDSKKTSSPSIKMEEPIISSKIEIDIEKLRIFKEVMLDEKSETEAIIMKGLERTVAMISMMVPPSEKEKYSLEAVTKNFKGKSGIELVLTGDKQSKEFNATVKELNAYAMNFIKEGNVSEALKVYDKVLEHKKMSKEEKSLILSHKADIYAHKGMLKKAESFYTQSLKTIQSSKNKKTLSFKAKKVWIRNSLAKIHKDLNQTKRAKEEFLEVEQMYLHLLKKSKKNEADKAWSLTLLANFYAEQKRWEKSLTIRYQAFALYQKIVARKPKEFNRGYCETLKALGVLSLRQGEWKKAEKYYKEALVLYQKLNKNEHLEILRQLAFIALKKEKYVEAQKKYENILRAYKKLDRNGTKQTLAIAQTLNDMVRLSFAKDKSINILSLNKKLFMARQLATKELKNQKQEAQSILATTYAYWGFISILQGDDERALKYYSQSLEQSRRFSISKAYSALLIKKEYYLRVEQSYSDMLTHYKEQSQQAEIMMLSGKFYLHSGISGAKFKLNKALKIYEQLEKKKNFYSLKIEEIHKLLKKKEASL